MLAAQEGLKFHQSPGTSFCLRASLCLLLRFSPFFLLLFFYHQLSWFDQKLKSLKRETTAGNSGVMFLSELERTGLKPKDDQESERLEPMGGARGQRLCICSLESSWV